MARASHRSATNRTSTFFFCDLRGYTTFVEERGDEEAADLLRAYRRLVRARVAQARGAEIKTEGDSFFVAFATARDALACAIGIFHDAERHSAANEFLPLQLGAGLHAGEPVAQDRGYVGSAVNIAARLAQNAGAGELLISETVRGLLRTSGLPPVTERADIVLKGVADAPRIWSLDWRAVAPDARVRAAARPSLPRPVIVVTLAAISLAIVGFGVSRVLMPASTPSMPAPGAAAIALPPHGALLFELDRTPAGGRQVRAAFGDATRDAVRFLGDGVEISVSSGSTVSLTVLDLVPDDFVAEFAAATVRGQGSYALWFRGAAGRQLQVQITPQTGELVIQIERTPDTMERLFGPASRLPRGAEQRVEISSRGREITVYRDGAEVGRAVDPRPVGGAVGFVVTAPRDREFVVRLSLLRVFAP